MSPEDEDDEDDIDRQPPPTPFKPPKNLAKVERSGEFDIQPAAGKPPPAPTPPGADVRMDRSAPKPGVRIPRPEDLGPPEVRMDKSPPKPGLKLPQPLEGPVDVRLPTHVPAPKPHLEKPLDLSKVDVVIDSQQRVPLVVGKGGEPLKGPRRIGIVDTTFARYNMGDAAEDELRKQGEGFDIVRRTVPGIKDLPVECKLLLERNDCDLVLACGMVGAQPIDKQCAHEASLALQWAMLATNRHILEVFVHEDEARDERQLAWLMDRRTREHAENAWALLFDPDRLRQNAGRGLRQGFEDAGPVRQR